MQPIRILEYITSATLGGAETSAMAVGSELKRRGHNMLWISPEGRSLTPVLSERGFSVWSPKTHGKIDPLTLLRVVRFIQSQQIQLVHTHLSTASLLGSLAARICKIPAVATVQGLNTAFCYRYATRVVAVSNAVRSHLVKQGLSAERVRVVFNSIDVSHFQNLPNRAATRCAMRLGPDEPVVMYAGRLSPEKGVALLPPILQQLRERIPTVRLLIVGEGAMRESLEQEFERLGLKDTAILVGFQTDTRPFLAAADLLLLPSYREGYGMVLAEAAAAGLPAVGSDVGGIPEVIVSGVTGKIAPVGDIQALAQGCASILEDRELYQRMSQAARGRAWDFCSIERNVSALESVFEEVL